ncbi:MAG TPA: hypothetical protein VFR06_06770, partial [Gallionellaceae bacterium]|nr:hypothetical protein [Gallionellaceae bacterium]
KNICSAIFSLIFRAFARNQINRGWMNSPCKRIPGWRPFSPGCKSFGAARRRRVVRIQVAGIDESGILLVIGPHQRPVNLPRHLGFGAMRHPGHAYGHVRQQQICRLQPRS